MPEVTCETCGKTINKTQWSMDKCLHHYCSQECHYKRHNWTSLEHKYNGKVRRGQEIGKSFGQAYLWHPCESCGKRRWIQIKKGKPSTIRCYSCAYKEYHKERLQAITWKGGVLKNTNGYRMVYLTADNPYFSMVNRQGLVEGISGYVMEHRLVVARNLGRCLRKDEVVHHINGIKTDNRIENLLLVTKSEHQNIIPVLQHRVRELEEKLNGRYGRSSSRILAESL